jgi:SAM-dependent methyltransferase
VASDGVLLDADVGGRDGLGLRARRAQAYERPRPEVQALVPRSSRRILDLGCSSGALGAALKVRQGAYVAGVEVDPQYAEDARSRLDIVLCGDLDSLVRDPSGIASLGRFDCIVAADVLEHLVDPWYVVRQLADVLDPDGFVVLSLPNVRYWETLWQVGVRGRWPRRDVGLFDRTHLRWFTLDDCRELLGQAGLMTIHVESLNHVLPKAGKIDRVAWRSRHVRRALHPFFAYQYLLLGQKRCSDRGVG